MLSQYKKKHQNIGTTLSRRVNRQSVSAIVIARDKFLSGAKRNAEGNVTKTIHLRQREKKKRIGDGLLS